MFLSDEQIKILEIKKWNQQNSTKVK
jgi:hypothetical protein